MKKSRNDRGSKVGKIIAVSGGPDSVFLVSKAPRNPASTILVHVNHGARGRDSDKDQKFVERLGQTMGMPVEVHKGTLGKIAAGFEEKARDERNAFLLQVKRKHGAGKILVAHTADDQVETVLMRVLEGAGISGLKGIPRKTPEGVERPLLDTWREDILEYLHKHKIPYRVDKTNFDTRFERNWIRHVLIPLLEKRYGKTIKKRIFALGERFREIDEFLEDTARRWMKRHVTTKPIHPRRGEGVRRIGQGVSSVLLPRKSFSRLSSAVRKKVLQLLCIERVGIAPNERLLESMDKLLDSGGPSARQNVGGGAVLRCRYDQALLEMTKPERKGEVARPTGFSAKILLGEKGRLPAAELKRLSRGARAAVFDATALRAPVSVRPLQTGDRIRPFGLDAEKKVKEILIDRKVPRDERWGRPAVCDAEGKIIWIPGVVRSSHAPVTERTRHTAILRLKTRVEDTLAALIAKGEADVQAGRVTSARSAIARLKRKLERPNPE